MGWAFCRLKAIYKFRNTTGFNTTTVHLPGLAAHLAPDDVLEALVQLLARVEVLRLGQGGQGSSRQPVIILPTSEPALI